ncbi:VOC family protein [Actinomadura barringtoniae]|uniref:VOC family protein n=1 Tax=Actinomadura barringtoniae TaxID=1427535 RepID=A0A939PMG1_9ACTN|nr:VOC family protein [Actinomadura barringtoniae]MBO2455000.1 VOC family protein [Actinomadura barringtoniae]
MRPRINLITLGVPDLAAARRFYVEGLGWEPSYEVEDEIVFIQIGPGLLLGLFADADTSPGPSPMTLAQNVDGEEEVVEVVARAERAGATVLKVPRPAPYGGFHGYFADPAGFRWEIAYNPGFSVSPDGEVTIKRD